MKKIRNMWNKIKDNLTSWVVIIAGLVLSFILFFTLTGKKYSLEDNDSIRSTFLKKGEGSLIVLLDLRGALEASTSSASLKSVDEFRILKNYLLKNKETIDGCVIRVNSSGGQVFAGRAIYGMIKEISVQIPTYAYIETVGASAAYHSILGVDKIFADRFSMVGSIGTMMQKLDYSQVFKMLGLEFQSIKSGKFKGDSDNYGDEGNSEAIKLKQEVVDQTADGFWKDVENERSLSKADLPEKVREGALCLGEEALELNLIDGVGSLEHACMQLLSEHLQGSTQEYSLLLLNLRKSGRSSSIIDYLKLLQ